MTYLRPKLHFSKHRILIQPRCLRVKFLDDLLAALTNYRTCHMQLWIIPLVSKIKNNSGTTGSILLNVDQPMSKTLSWHGCSWEWLGDLADSFTRAIFVFIDLLFQRNNLSVHSVFLENQFHCQFRKKKTAGQRGKEKLVKNFYESPAFCVIKSYFPDNFCFKHYYMM